MADFCKQCSIDIFGSDYGDLAWGKWPDGMVVGGGHIVNLLCEGCGPAAILEDGTCVSGDCLEKHPKEPDDATNT